MIRKIATVAITTTWVVLCVAIGFQYTPRAFALALIGQLCVVALILLGLTDEQEPLDDSGRDCCDGCRYDLDGGYCRINAEKECREGGGFELWEEVDK